MRWREEGKRGPRADVREMRRKKTDTQGTEKMERTQGRSVTGQMRLEIISGSKIAHRNVHAAL